MNGGLIILICVILLGVIMYFLIDYSDSEFAKKRKFKRKFPYSTENGYEENSMVKYRIKNYVEKTIKPKMHLSNYGYVVCSVRQKTLSTKIKYHLSVWIGYSGIPSNDIDSNNAQTEFSFEKDGFSIVELETELKQELDDFVWNRNKYKK